jgi:protein-tyrosine phosphatase
MDDGPKDVHESVAMAKMAIDDGITRMFATPHILDGLYLNGTAMIRQSCERLKSSLPADLDLLYGADVRICHDLIARIENETIPTLNGSGYLLLEFPSLALPPRVDDIIIKLRERKIIPIITHPERHMLLAQRPTLLSRLRDCGAMSQITAQSITGGFGREIRNASCSMIRLGLVDFVASDAHDIRIRPPRLSEAYREVVSLFDERTAIRIFVQNQEKVLEAAQSLIR